MHRAGCRALRAVEAELASETKRADDAEAELAQQSAHIAHLEAQVETS